MARTLTIDFQPPVATVPVVNVTSGPTRSRMSRVPGRDTTEITFTSDADYTAYQARVVPSSTSLVTEGTQIESGSGGTANAPRTIELTDDELVAAGILEGGNQIKIFAQNIAGWSSS